MILSEKDGVETERTLRKSSPECNFAYNIKMFHGRYSVGRGRPRLSAFSTDFIYNKHHHYQRCRYRNSMRVGKSETSGIFFNSARIDSPIYACHKSNAVREPVASI